MSDRRHIGQINALNIQKKAINKAIELLGSDLWIYEKNSGRRCNRMATIHEAAAAACKFDVSFHQFKRWIQHYICYGETPEETRQRGGYDTGKTTNLTAADLQQLKTIVDDNPQLYLDKIQTKMEEATGTLWHTSHLTRAKWAMLKIWATGATMSINDVIVFHEMV